MKGFSLIEAVIYIALLGMIMTGAVAVSYQLVDGSQSLNAKNTAGEEGNFVLGKIEWALSGASASTISGSGCAQALAISRYGSPSSVDFRRNVADNTIEMQEGTGGYVVITTPNVSASCLTFAAVGSGTMVGVAATTTINDIHFAVTKYVRK